MHEVLEDWLTAESWLLPEPLKAARVALTALERRSGTRLTSSPAGGQGLRKLRLIVGALTDLLREERVESADVAIEAPLVSADEQLWGVPDLVVTASRTMIIDFKTSFESSDASEAARMQLLFYSHLLEADKGQLADELVVIAPSGVHRAPNIRADVEQHVDALITLRDSGEREANPAPGLCTFCPFRLECEPFWAVLGTWSERDAIQGRVLGLETALNGVRSLRLEGDDGEMTVTIPPRVALPELENGAQLRLIRIAAGHEASRWTASRLSRAAVVEGPARDRLD